MTTELPPRPEPPRRWSETLQAWIAWFGPARLIVSAVSVVAVAAGVAWLVRVPAPTTEAGLPFATTVATTSPGTSDAGSGPAVAAATLPPPESTVVQTVRAGPALVHVAGAVTRPGVYELDADARVHSAIEAAGGPSAHADLDGLNLAAAVGDGQRIYVPEAGEVDPATVPSEPAPTDGLDHDVDDGGESGSPIDLNTATASQLEALPGIGPATAAAIIDDRERHGPFAAVTDLERVPGIGPAKLAAIADRVTV